jgi:hypothetical protein
MGIKAKREVKKIEIMKGTDPLHVASLNADGTISSLPDHWTGQYELKPNGFVMRRKFLLRHLVPLFTFINDLIDPLTFWPQNEPWVRPYRKWDGYDYATVPWLLQSFVSAVWAIVASILHDSTFEYHAWWRPTGPERVTLWKANNMLYRSARAADRANIEAFKTPGFCGRVQSFLDNTASRIDASLAWVAVNGAGWAMWGADPITLANEARIEVAEAVLKVVDPAPPSEGTPKIPDVKPPDVIQP